MTVEVTENSGAKGKFESLGGTPPEGLTIMPAGQDEFDDQQYIVFPDGTDTVRKLLEQNGVVYSEVEFVDETSTLVLRSEELIIPTLYLAYRVVRDNWDQIEFALDKISEYYSKRYDSEIEMSVEQETSDGETTKLTYRGPARGLDELKEEISSIVRSDDE